MWRDRTNLYISYRQSYAYHAPKRKHPGSHGFSDAVFPASAAGPEDRQGLLAGTSGYSDDGLPPGDLVIEMDLLPPRWADVTDEITELLATVAHESQALDRLHQKHVLPAFDDDASSKRAEEGEIERRTQEITRAFHRCQAAIKRVDSMVKEAKQAQAGGGGMSKAEEQMARNIQVALAARVQEASAGFRKKQSAYLKKLRGLSGFGAPTPSAGGLSDRSPTPLLPQNYAPDPSLLESDADRSFSQSTLLTTRQALLQGTTDNSHIVQREREIEEIARGIIELSDFFRDLQTMVIDQGTMLDRIDYNVERMAMDVKGADRELVVAAGYQRRSTKRKIILLLILIVVGMIILLVLKPKRSSLDSNSDASAGTRRRKLRALSI